MWFLGKAILSLSLFMTKIGVRSLWKLQLGHLWLEGRTPLIKSIVMDSSHFGQLSAILPVCCVSIVNILYYNTIY